MFGFRFGKKEITEKQLREWQAKYRVEKIVEVLHTGDTISRLRAMDVLEEINMTQVKRELIKCLDDENKDISLKAAQALENMGVTPEERKLVEAIRQKHR
jgi:HEAT repeat protein